jgi:hypothetical protein
MFTLKFNMFCHVVFAIHSFHVQEMILYFLHMKKKLLLTVVTDKISISNNCQYDLNSKG